MDYSALQDEEINIKVGEIQGWNAFYLHQDKSVTFRDDKGRIKGRKNYCNNPADAFPIIEANRISLRNRYEGDWKAENEWGESHFHVACNPLRAAMVVFLMMQEGE
ncbi:TPA: phage protein NinX family protein [Klebsiella variicola subsp. variicola]